MDNYFPERFTILLNNSDITYEEVAKKCNEQNPKKQIKASSVESCIRTAINSAWKNKKEKIKQLTGEKKKPTVGRLVFEIADAINNSDK